MTKHRSTIVGVFEDRSQADRAVSELRQAGFRDDQIGIAMRQVEGAEATAETTGETYAEEGGIAGVLTGLGLGALAGLGVLAGAIPVVGPAIAGGTLGIILSNAAAGAGIVGVAGALIGYGIPEEEANYYSGEFEAGRTIVTVQADGRYDEAAAILRRHGAYDMQSRGAMGTAAGAAMGTAAGEAAATRTTKGGQTMQVREEELHARKTPVEAGEVRVRKEVHTEHKTMEVPVRHEEVVVERHAPTGRQAAASDIAEGEEVRIPVMEEKVQVEKTPVVKEEVTVGKRVVQDTERVAGEVRKEEVRIEREGDVDIHGRDAGKNRK